MATDNNQSATTTTPLQMKKELSYAAILSFIFFLGAVLPGVITILCGSPVLIASIGIPLGIILLIKGKIGKKIYGEDSPHSSSPNAAFFVLGITLIAAIFQLYKVISMQSLYASMGYELSSAELLEEHFPALLIASFFWTVVFFCAVLIRSKIRQIRQRKKSTPSQTTVE